MDTETFVATKCPPEMLPLPGFGRAPQIDRGGCPFADSAHSANDGPHGVAQSARTTRTVDTRRRKLRHAHTHTHTHRERDRDRERE
eukprot:COSAG03_NODE_4983_length_1372_cov_4.323645_3_plen_85_part_01